MRRITLLSLFGLSVFGGGASSSPSRDPLPPIATHDNERPAGDLRDGMLTLAFEIRRGTWHPNGADRPGTPMLAFAQRGGPLMLPGPMIRIPVGTRLHVTVQNRSDTTLVVRGLTEDPRDSLLLAPGATGEVRSIATEPGNRYYQLSTPGRRLRVRSVEDGHLAGAIIVDGPSRDRMQERIYVLTGSFHSRDSLGRLTNDREIYVLNGRPWPHTSRLSAAVGDSLRFRILNVSRDLHPMHLHGVYFRVDSRGGAHRDTTYAPTTRRMAVTEALPPGATMSMVWSPDRPGTWLMHCHLTFHVTPNTAFGRDSLTIEQADHMLDHGHPGMDPDKHVEKGMGGLMVAIAVKKPSGWRLPDKSRRVVRFVIPRDSAPTDRVPSFAPYVKHGGALVAPVGRRGPGAPLMLKQGEATTVRIVNGSHDPIAIHWHGMEIESYYDGVVGLGGTPGKRLRAIAPGDSFDVRMTPPRAGTFIYHTHMMEIRQQLAGLWGAMLVLPDSAPWDPTRDHVFITGAWRGDGPLLNGHKTAPALELEAGITHRLRLINITPANPGLQYHLIRSDSAAVHWTLHAKDGMDLPPHQRPTRRAVQPVSMGETYDMLFTPTESGEYVMQARGGATLVLASQPIRVVRRP